MWHKNLSDFGDISSAARRDTVDQPSRSKALVHSFEERFGRGPEIVAEAPGRVNLIGEHTDYNEGFVLPAAIDRSTLVAVAVSEGVSSRVWSSNTGGEAGFQAARPRRADDGRWDNYVLGSAWALGKAGHALPEFYMSIESNVPLGAGLSSSAALEVGVIAALGNLSGAAVSSLDIAKMAHRAETEFVGVPCGIMDQFASALGQEDAALLIDCRSERLEAVPLGLESRGIVIAIVDSGVSRQLAGSAYRDRREECREACRFLRGPLSKPVTSLRDVTLEDLALVGDQIPRVLLRRVRHVASENARVLECVSALREGRMEEVGTLMAESHRSLRDDYEVSCPEIDLLVSLAGSEDEVVGARLTGAGFGGCTVNLVKEDGLDRFEKRVVEEYATRTGRKPKLHVCKASAGVQVSPL